VTCGTCRFFSREDNYVGECRRYAPRPTADMNEWTWPVVHQAHWCGEFQPKSTEVDGG
jgi:hypothetical protein